MHFILPLERKPKPPLYLRIEKANTSFTQPASSHGARAERVIKEIEQEGEGALPPGGGGGL